MILLIWGVLAGVAQDTRLQVVTIVSPLTNIVKNVGGVSIDLHGPIPGETDSYTCAPTPSDVHYLVAADLMILNDLGLETPTETLALANRKPSTQIFKLGEHTIAPQNIRERAGEKTFAD